MPPFCEVEVVVSIRTHTIRSKRHPFMALSSAYEIMVRHPLLTPAAPGDNPEP
ncbi:MAG: hypothetical protein VX938_02915 [Myxococcota bacterium]|nr:hypothetical protein [Myxococcota bacterium]